MKSFLTLFLTFSFLLSYSQSEYRVLDDSTFAPISMDIDTTIGIMSLTVDDMYLRMGYEMVDIAHVLCDDKIEFYDTTWSHVWVKRMIVVMESTTLDCNDELYVAPSYILYVDPDKFPHLKDTGYGIHIGYPSYVVYD